MDDTIVRDYVIYKKVPKCEFNHDKHYEYAEDDQGSLLKPRYGHDGDGDWHITCYENLSTGRFNEYGNVKFYYESSGRVPFEYIFEFDWEEVDGLNLGFLTVNDVKMPCFIKWDENKCYVITK